jgi:hypothetical protein
MYAQGNNSDYHIELSAFWPQVYDGEKGEFYSYVQTDPGKLIYWLDILNDKGVYEKYSV